jgi:hypothetical protein
MTMHASEKLVVHTAVPLSVGQLITPSVTDVSSDYLAWAKFQ